MTQMPLVIVVGGDSLAKSICEQLAATAGPRGYVSSALTRAEFTLTQGLRRVRARPCDRVRRRQRAGGDACDSYRGRKACGRDRSGPKSGTRAPGARTRRRLNLEIALGVRARPRAFSGSRRSRSKRSARRFAPRWHVGAVRAVTCDSRNKNTHWSNFTMVTSGRRPRTRRRSASRGSESS